MTNTVTKIHMVIIFDKFISKFKQKNMTETHDGTRQLKGYAAPSFYIQIIHKATTKIRTALILQ